MATTTQRVIYENILSDLDTSAIAGTGEVAATGATIDVDSNFNIDNGDTLTLVDGKNITHVLTVGSGAGQITKPAGGTSGENNAVFAGRIGAVLSQQTDSPFSVTSISETDPNDYEIVIKQNFAGATGNSTPVISAGQGTAGWSVSAGFTGGVNATGIIVDPEYVYITPLAMFSQADDKIIQLIPGVPEPQTETSGIGLVEEDFRIAVWVRVFLDSYGQSTERITNATYGAMKIVGDVRQALIQSDAGGVATVPVRWVSGSDPIESEDAPGWVYYEDTYRIGYEIAWS